LGEENIQGEKGGGVQSSPECRVSRVGKPRVVTGRKDPGKNFEGRNGLEMEGGESSKRRDGGQVWEKACKGNMFRVVRVIFSHN